MSDPLRGVSPGDPPSRLLRADTFNLTMSAVRWYRDNVAAVGRRSGAPGDTSEAVPVRLEVRVKAGADAIPERAIVGLGDPVIDPMVNPRGAQNTPVFAAADPTAGGVFGVATAPIPANSIGTVTIFGAAVCNVQVNDDAHEFAAPIDGETGKLGSAESGPARIVWKAASSSTARALVFIGGCCGSGTGSGSATDTLSAGAWLAGLSEDDCVRMTVVSGDGKCSGIDTEQVVDLPYNEGAAKWVSAEDAFTGTGSGGTGQVTFSNTAPTPTASIDGVGGWSLGPDGTGGWLFAFGGAVLCGGTSKQCKNALVVRFACGCCDTVPVVEAVVGPLPDQLTVTFGESVDWVGGDVVVSGDESATATYVSGTGTATLVFTLSAELDPESDLVATIAAGAVAVDGEPNCEIEEPVDNEVATPTEPALSCVLATQHLQGDRVYNAGMVGWDDGEARYFEFTLSPGTYRVLATLAGCEVLAPTQGVGGQVYLYEDSDVTCSAGEHVTSWGADGNNASTGCEGCQNLTVLPGKTRVILRGIQLFFTDELGPLLIRFEPGTCP